MPRPTTTTAAPTAAPTTAKSEAGSRAAPPAGRIDMADERAVQQWCDHLGITRQQLEEAVKAVGNDAAALKRHLLIQGASAGPS
ncbi:MAG: DUF3606 domain-containing protein [Rubrivivax sp.]|nr:DUF3606 domain-containing protein [Rubrivivax sp.]